MYLLKMKIGFLLQVYSFSGGLVILPRNLDTLVIPFQTSIDHVEENLLANKAPLRKKPPFL